MAEPPTIPMMVPITATVNNAPASLGIAATTHPPTGYDDGGEVAPESEPSEAYAKGGAVGDTKPRYVGTIHKYG